MFCCVSGVTYDVSGIIYDVSGVMYDIRGVIYDFAAFYLYQTKSVNCLTRRVVYEYFWIGIRQKAFLLRYRISTMFYIIKMTQFSSNCVEKISFNIWKITNTFVLLQKKSISSTISLATSNGCVHWKRPSFLSTCYAKIGQVFKAREFVHFVGKKSQ